MNRLKACMKRPAPSPSSTRWSKGQRHAHALARDDLAVDHPRLQIDAAQAKDGYLGVIQDRSCEQRTARQTAKAGDRKRAARQISGRAASLARR